MRVITDNCNDEYNQDQSLSGWSLSASKEVLGVLPRERATLSLLLIKEYPIPSATYHETMEQNAPVDTSEAMPGSPMEEGELSEQLPSSSRPDTSIQLTDEPSTQADIPTSEDERDPDVFRVILPNSGEQARRRREEQRLAEEMDQVTDMFNVLSVPFREEADRDREPLEMHDQHFIPPTNVEDAFQRACRSQALDWMRNANLETVMRMLAYGKRFHTNPRYNVEIRITPVDNPQAEPAVLSLRPHGVVKTSPNVPLDPRNVYSHFSISHPTKDPSTLDDWQWLAHVAESLRGRGMVLSRDGKDGPSMFDAITCPVAWLRDAKVVILADEMTGATEFHLASLCRSTVLLRAPSLTRKNVQILVDVLAPNMRFIESFLIILPCAPYERLLPKLEIKTISDKEKRYNIRNAVHRMCVEIAEIQAPPDTDRRVRIVYVPPPLVGSERSWKRFYVETIRDTLPNMEGSGGFSLKNNVYVISAIRDVSNAADPDGRIVLPHQLLGHLISISEEFLTWTNSHLLYDFNGAVSIFQFNELALRNALRHADAASRGKALLEIREYQLRHPEVCAPDQNSSLTKAEYPWELTTLVATGSTSMVGQLVKQAEYEKEIRKFDDEKRTAHRIRARILPFEQVVPHAKEEEREAQKRTIAFLKVSAEQVKYLENATQEQMLEQKKLSAYGRAEWYYHDEQHTLPRQAMASLTGWKGKPSRNGASWAECTPRDMVGAAMCFGLKNFLAGPVACEDEYNTMMAHSLGAKATVMALMGNTAIQYFLGPKLNAAKQREVREGVLKCILQMQIERSRAITLAEFVCETGLPMNSINRLLDAVAATKLFGVYPQRPLDYGTFLTERIDCLCDMRSWAAGKVVRALEPGEFPTVEACVPYDYTEHGVCVQQNAITVTRDNPGYLYRALGEDVDIEGEVINVMLRHQETVQQAKADKEVKELNDRREPKGEPLVQRDVIRLTVQDMPRELRKLLPLNPPRSKVQVYREFRQGADERPATVRYPAKSGERKERRIAETKTSPMEDGATLRRIEGADRAECLPGGPRSAVTPDLPDVPTAQAKHCLLTL